MQKAKRTDLLSQILSILQILLAAIPLVYQFQMAGKISEYTYSIAIALLSILIVVLLLILPQKAYHDYLQIAGAVLTACSACMFFTGGLLSLADWIADVNFWGDATQAPAIIVYGCMMICGTILGVVNCYIKKT